MNAKQTVAGARFISKSAMDRLYFLRRILSCLGQASDGIHYQGLNGTEIATSHKGKKAKVAADPHITDKPIHWRPALREYSVFYFPSPN